jgi:hypothetical protein
MADETRQIQVLMGPYRDHRLTVSSADAESAINNHWAVDPHAVAAPDDHPHPPLTEEERTAALEAATAWAQLQWDTAQQVKPPDPPPDPLITRAKKPDEKRDMTPDEPAGRYTTRDKR